MMIGFLFAILSAFFYAAMNAVDKYVVHKKVKHPLGFSIVAAMALTMFGLLLSLFSDWNVKSSALIFPVLSGALAGFLFIIYYKILEKHDVSHIIGLVYVYPLFVALLAFFFLGETLSYNGYIGMVLMIIGALLLEFQTLVSIL